MNNSEVGYTDGDVMIIDNVRHLEEQYQRLPSQNLIILCCKGRMQLDVNGRTLRFGENEVLFSSPGAMLSGFILCRLRLQDTLPLQPHHPGTAAPEHRDMEQRRLRAPHEHRASARRGGDAVQPLLYAHPP